MKGWGNDWGLGRLKQKGRRKQIRVKKDDEGMGNEWGLGRLIQKERREQRLGVRKMILEWVMNRDYEDW